MTKCPSTDFYKMSKLPVYVFEELNQLKAIQKNNGCDVIDFGMGNPDLPPPQHVIDTLVEAVKNPKLHGYSISQGREELRNAVSLHYQRRYGVEIDPKKEVVVTIGSKEGIATIARVITRPGDMAIVSNPCYPIHAYSFIISNAAVYHLPKASDESFMQQLRRAVENSCPKPVALVLNYPCNPTAEIVTLDFYEEVVDYCRHHNIIIISDIAYGDIYFDDLTPPPSALQVKGAKDIVIEFSTVSKSYSLAGWRLGFAAGNEELVAGLSKLKGYIDYGTFAPLQIAAAAALNGSQYYVEYARMIYKKRRDVLCNEFAAIGWNVQKPLATMFSWTKIPPKFAHLSSIDFCKLLIQKANISVAPGSGFGSGGEGYIRIALVQEEDRIREAAERLKPLFK